MSTVNQNRAVTARGVRCLVTLAMLGLLVACEGVGAKKSDSALPLTTPVTTVLVATTVPSATTLPPAPPTTLRPTTTNPILGPEKIATAFVKAVYTWRHTDYALSTLDKLLIQSCAPYASAGLDAMLSGANASPETDANITDATPGVVNLARSMVAPGPTATSVAYIARVTINDTTTTTKGSFAFTAEAQLALHLTALGWKVTAMDASGVNGPSYSGPAANAHVRIADPAYGGPDQQLGF